MLTYTQYALLIAIPSCTVIVAHCVLSWYANRLLKKLYIGFDRLDHAMSSFGERMSATSVTTEPRKRFE